MNAWIRKYYHWVIAAVALLQYTCSESKRLMFEIIQIFLWEESLC